MKEFYTIGEISKIYNVSADTLRYYDKIGLLRPWNIGENGYRYYSKAQFETISTIMLLRSMGTPIAELTKALQSASPAGITDALDSYVSNVDAEIRRLNSLKKEAASLKQNIIDVSSKEDPHIEEVPAMWMFSKPFGDEDELDLDSILAVNRLARRSWTTLAGIISTVTRENLLSHRFHCYDRYGYLSETPVGVKSEYLSVIPAGRYIIGSARVHSLEHSEMDCAYLDCLDFAQRNQCRITGDAIERNILSLYSDDPYNPVMYFKIYIPIEQCSIDCSE